jgi:hypothetical protein
MKSISQLEEERDGWRAAARARGFDQHSEFRAQLLDQEIIERLKADASVKPKADDLAPKIAALEARIAALEAKPTLRYVGVFDEQRGYVPGEFTTLGGATWHCNAACVGIRPGTDESWTLAVKKGRDGRDGRGAR